ncbi:hypothetical protein Sjap_006984 [Stephania japonica]|uniref:Uncharacterized protein n=1 Tax=Stephania japonica TaxID=461633 RepID=A0AAP0K6Y8_9MAGN
MEIRFRATDLLFQATPSAPPSPRQQQYINRFTAFDLIIVVSVAAAPRLAVREAADRALAIAASGRTRWSRAILASRRLMRLKLKKVRKPRSPSSGVGARRSAPEVETLRRKEKAPAALERRKCVLGRLVPGCRRLSLPLLLDEASDYISALQMQVRAMTALTELLCSAGPSQLAGSLASDGRFDSTRLVTPQPPPPGGLLPTLSFS